jgi:thymidylate synthase
MEDQYLNLLRKALDGDRRTCRNGQTRAVFAAQLRHDMRQGFPLLTTKAMKPSSILGELLWFIEGGKNSPVPYRMDNNRLREIQGLAPDKKTIWSHDCEKPDWLPRIRFSGDCGRIYGSQWRDWDGVARRATGLHQGVDQLGRLVALIKSDPSSRYMKVTAWNPSELSDMCLPPCHGDFQCFVRIHPAFGGRASRLLSLHMVQRSCDLFLGVPYNIASYGYLLTMLAYVTDCTPHELVIALNDAHIYEAHVEAVQTQLRRAPHRLPTLLLDPVAPPAPSVESLDDFRMEHFALLDYAPDKAIKAPLL